jgi:hypothetical protein
MLTYMVRRKGIPTLEVHYPHDDNEAKVMVSKIKAFLEGL